MEKILAGPRCAWLDGLEEARIEKISCTIDQIYFRAPTRYSELSTCDLFQNSSSAML